MAHKPHHTAQSSLGHRKLALRSASLPHVFAMGLWLMLGACRSTGADTPVEPGTSGGTGTQTGSATGSTAGTTVGGTTTGTTTGGSATGVRFIGRMPTDANTMSWSGSAVELSFAGTEGSIEFTAQNGNNYVGLSIDGGNITRTFVASSASIAFGPLANGNHIVRATKLSEARLGEMTYNGASFDGQAQGFASTRRLEFIGDSITAAYGIDGNAPCTNTAALEDATQSFATLTADALSGDASLVAWAGKGVIRNDTSDLTSNPVVMPNLWTRYDAGNANSVYTFPAADAPQVVVITLGTNDYEYTGDDANTLLRAPLDQNAFIAGYVAFIQSVQAKYPQAKFVLCSSPMLTDSYPQTADMQHSNLVANLNSVAAQFSSSDVVVLDFPALTTAQATGCGGHPGVSAHAAMAQLLTAKIKNLMGW